MAVTIQISRELKTLLDKQKLFKSETYEDVIMDLVEDRLDFTEETKRNIERGLADARAGRTVPLSELKKRYGLR